MQKEKAFIFLDFDGVLNSDAYFAQNPEAKGNRNLDPKAIARLCRFVESENCYVIISSSWREGRSVRELRAILIERGFIYPTRILGRTAKLKKGGDDAPRGHEIRRFMREFPGVAFVIFDDDADMEPLQKHLVQTDPRIGLTSKDLKRAKAVLAAQGR